MFLGHVLRVRAQDLGLIVSNGTQLVFNWEALAHLRWADAGVLPFCSLFFNCPSLLRMLLTICGLSQPAGSRLCISAKTG